MIIRKACHGIVTVVVIRLVSHLDALHAAVGRSLFKVFGEKLALFVEVVAGALFRQHMYILGLGPGEGGGWKKTYNINQRIQRTRPFLDEFRGIVLAPLGLVVVAKVPIKCLLAPGAVTRVRNGGECADGLVFAGVTEELPLVSTTSLTHPVTQDPVTQGTFKRTGGEIQPSKLHAHPYCDP